MKTVIICKNLFLQLWWSILQSQFKLPHRKWPFSSSFMLHMWGYVSEICLLSILFTRLLFVLSNNCQEDFIFSQFLSLCCHCWHLDKHPQVLERYLPSWLNQVTPNLVDWFFSPREVVIDNVAYFITNVQLFQNYLLWINYS